MYKACFVADNTYDPGVSPGFANQCILGDMYLTSNLLREASFVADISYNGTQLKALGLEARLQRLQEAEKSAIK